MPIFFPPHTTSSSLCQGCRLFWPNSYGWFFTTLFVIINKIESVLKSVACFLRLEIKLLFVYYFFKELWCVYIKINLAEYKPHEFACSSEPLFRYLLLLQPLKDFSLAAKILNFFSPTIVLRRNSIKSILTQKLFKMPICVLHFNVLNFWLIL